MPLEHLVTSLLKRVSGAGDDEEQRQRATIVSHQQEHRSEAVELAYKLALKLNIIDDVTCMLLPAGVGHLKKEVQLHASQAVAVFQAARREHQDWYPLEL